MDEIPTFSNNCVLIDSKSDLLTITVAAQERKHQNSNFFVYYVYVEMKCGNEKKHTI